MFSTAQCKAFIHSLSQSGGLKLVPPDNWIRTKKYYVQTDQARALARDFSHPSGAQLTLIEVGNNLCVYEWVGAPVSLNDALSTSFHTPESMEEEYWGQKRYKGALLTSDILTFVKECTDADPLILEDADANLCAKSLSSWTCWDAYTMAPTVDEHPIDSFTQYCDSELELFYPDETGEPVYISSSQVAAAYSVGLTDFDTQYRIWVYATHDGLLLLGCNEPD